MTFMSVLALGLALATAVPGMALLFFPEAVTPWVFRYLYPEKRPLWIGVGCLGGGILALTAWRGLLRAWTGSSVIVTLFITLATGKLALLFWRYPLLRPVLASLFQTRTPAMPAVRIVAGCSLAAGAGFLALGLRLWTSP